MRINKFFTDQGQCSRREADRLITAGRVKINGRTAVLGDQVTAEDTITLDNKKIVHNAAPIYIMYHKPVGVTCTSDPNTPGNIIDAVKYPSRIFAIGRLDKTSTGLIFLTNDGEIVNNILRAQFGHEKEYEVEVHGPYPDSFLQKMAAGVKLSDYKTQPCKTARLSTRKFSIILTEGKNRQIRRMTEALGFTVMKLHRVRIMNVHIGDLKLGEWKNIPEKDLAELKLVLEKQNKTMPKDFDVEE